MNKALKIIVVVVLVIVVLLVAVPFLIPVNQFKPTIEQKASEVLGRKVQLGDLSLSLLSGSVSAESLSIGDDPKFSSSPFLTAKSLKVGVELLPLILSKTLNVTGVTITSPEVILLHNASGTWNYSTLGGTAAKQEAKPAAAPKSSGAGAAADISISKLNLTDGTIIVGEANSQKRSTYNHLNVTASDVSITSKFPVKVTADLPGGGKFDVEGTVGPVDQTDTSLTPLDSKLKITTMNLGSTGLLDPSMGLGGILDLDSNLSSQGGIAQVKGTVKLSKAQLVAGGSPAGVPVTVNMDTKYNLHKNTGVLEPSTLNIGSAVAHLGGTYETGESTSVNMKMDAKDMPAKDLEAFLPAVGVHLPTGASLTAGTVNANLNITGPTSKLVIAGNIGMFNGVLAGFDLGSKMQAVASMAGIKSTKDMKIEKLTSNVKVAPAGIQADDFDSVVDGIGELTGAGTVDAKNELDFKMIAALSSQAGSASSAGGGGCGGGGLKVPFQVQGTTANPKIIPDVGGLAEGLFKSKLGCAGGLAGLAGTSGKAAGQTPADAINALGGLLKKKKP